MSSSTDLDLHCLQRRANPGSAEKGLIVHRNLFTLGHVSKMGSHQSANLDELLAAAAKVIGTTVFHVPSDGNCMFSAIVDQLKLIGNFKYTTQSLRYSITKTYLYNFDPLKPHIYIVKLGFTGVYIIVLISTPKHRLWVEVVLTSTHNLCFEQL